MPSPLDNAGSWLPRRAAWRGDQVAVIDPEVPPGELYEAAEIDGTSSFQKFWHVTWPQLAPVTFFIIVMSPIGGLQGVPFGYDALRVVGLHPTPPFVHMASRMHWQHHHGLELVSVFARGEETAFIEIRAYTADE